MTCADFEGWLTALLAEEGDPADRARRLTTLRGHVEACPHCGDASDLLEFLSLPPAERDLAEPPADSYWDEFEAGLRRRLAQSGPREARGRVSRAGLAAALLLAAAGAWLVLSPGEAQLRKGRVGTGGEGADEIPATLEALLRDAEPHEALAGLDFLVGLRGVPETAAGVADEARDQSETPGTVGPLFPDPEQMDAEARRALMEWLRGRAIRGRGVDS